MIISLRRNRRTWLHRLPDRLVDLLAPFLAPAPSQSTLGPPFFDISQRELSYSSAVTSVATTLGLRRTGTFVATVLFCA